MRFNKRKAGFTLTELLVVITLLAVLLALVVPAIERARETARREGCKNHLQQLACAFQLHQDSQGGFPPAHTTVPAMHGWIVNLLPYFDQGILAVAYDRKQHFYATANEPVALQPFERVFCPSAPDAPRVMAIGNERAAFGTRAIVGDYLVNDRLSAAGWAAGRNLDPALPLADDIQPIQNIRDGAAFTFLIHEQAGRPDHYVLGARQPDRAALADARWCGAWTSFQSFAYQGYGADGLAPGAACSINCNNSQGIYSFHPGGANAGFCDGSVRFLNVATPVELVFALATRDGGEHVGDESPSALP